MPADWSWATYAAEESTDAFAKPYCDWLQNGGWDDAWGEESCEEIEGVLCDSDGCESCYVGPTRIL